MTCTDEANTAINIIFLRYLCATNALDLLLNDFLTSLKFQHTITYKLLVSHLNNKTLLLYVGEAWNFVLWTWKSLEKYQ